MKRLPEVTGKRTGRTRSTPTTIPTAEKHGEHHLCTYGRLAGMALMAVSLLLFLK